MDFEKAFKCLADMVDRSVNYHTYDNLRRIDYHNLAYRYKVAIQSYSRFGEGHKFTYMDVRGFEDYLGSFNHNMCLYQPWVKEE